MVRRRLGSHVPAFDAEAVVELFDCDLSRIAMNEALGRMRRKRPAVELSSLPQGALEAQIIQFPLVAPADDPEKSMARREIQHVVEGAIDELPELFRIVFITRVVEGMNVEETAEILDLKPETVKTRLHRAGPCCAIMSRKRSARLSWKPFLSPAAAAIG